MTGILHSYEYINSRQGFQEVPKYADSAQRQGYGNLYCYAKFCIPWPDGRRQSERARLSHRKDSLFKPAAGSDDAGRHVRSAP